jgi:hypothetical protein
MSAISNEVEPALYAKLNVSGVTSLATGGVHNETTTAGLPYVIFGRQANRTIETFGGVIAEDDLWAIKAYADENSHATKSPRQLITEILIAAETAIGGSLTLGVGETWEVKREMDLMLPPEQKEYDAPVFAGGIILRIVASNG